MPPPDILRYPRLIFDFDGVLADTNPIRVDGFRLLFQGFPESKVDAMVRYAEANGGMSRYEKIRYFFKELIGEPVSEEKVVEWSARYSDLVKRRVIEAEAVKGSIEFLARFHRPGRFAIVSGSDQEELRSVCQARGLRGYFAEILGSPARKEENLQRLLGTQKWQARECVFIGDTLNDLTAARAVGIDFVGRNSGMVDWRIIGGVPWFDDFTDLTPPPAL
ncbi:MAG: hypothetical protein A3G34_09250 [Candidatus Lindowbacteria bacterium RIFCSPLOWO2_12_FULL_62_27]|nr:MAG: hypothetical protein A3I06_07915 [Candidatus Lindowbacteria bacterium RIFCSPLOWO2_02_FULL_62_12]OGH60225.1 MAG: hypothetical protein A3G34_09250 [Candidatus Lindowbacteria bacterium RIFCSPLOWO2_12_FULL_62_27]